MLFTNPAQNFAKQQLSLDDLVTQSPYSAFLVRNDSSYPEDGIMQGFDLAIDRVSCAHTSSQTYNCGRA